MVNIVYQLRDKFPCKLEEEDNFGDMDQKDDVARQKVETLDDLVRIVLDDAKPDQVVKIGAQLLTNIRL